MLSTILFPSVSHLRVDAAVRQDDQVVVFATTTGRTARCPRCRRRSRRVHSRYERTLTDLPCCGSRLTIRLRVRRFVCWLDRCVQRIFTERLPALVAPFARRTQRAQERVRQHGFALGGAPGARHASREGLPISRRTVLRAVRATPLPSVGPVRVLGVDDWAQRKGRKYGTILVNLETHRVIDLLPDRTAATLAAWLRTHPEIEIISRDRAGAYADGARQGAPHARQVADRFHLLKNVTEALERYLTRKHAALRQAAIVPSPRAAVKDQTAPPPEAAESEPAPSPKAAEGEPAPPAAAQPGHLSRDARLCQERRERRYARYTEVMALHAQGRSVRDIARLLGVARGTVQRFLRAEGFPEQQPRPLRPSLVAPFLPYLRERWDAGCHNAKQLWHEIRDQGFTGGHTVVAQHLQAWRTPKSSPPTARGAHPTHPAAVPVPASPRHVCWLLLRPLDTLSDDERAYLTRLYHTCPHIAVAEALVEEFATVLRERDVAGWYAWLHGMEGSDIAEFQAVARGMWQDRLAIEAAVALDWSNGQVEGQVNRLKVTKRAMYGRAKFDLLRHRVLHPA